MACRNFHPLFLHIPCRGLIFHWLWSWFVYYTTVLLPSFTDLTLVLSFVGFDLGLCIFTIDLCCFTPVSPSVYLALILPFIGVGLGLEFTPLFSRQRLDKCKQHLPCLLGLSPFLSSFMLLTCSMSSDISSCQVSSSRSIPTVPPIPPFSTFAMLLVCSVSSDTFSSLQYQWHKFPSPLFWRGIFSDDEWPFELPDFALQCSSISRSHGLITLMERFPSGRCATIHCEGSSPNTWFGFRWPLNSLQLVGFG